MKDTSLYSPNASGILALPSLLTPSPLAAWFLPIPPHSPSTIPPCPNLPQLSHPQLVPLNYHILLLQFSNFSSLPLLLKLSSCSSSYLDRSLVLLLYLQNFSINSTHLQFFQILSILQNKLKYTYQLLSLFGIISISFTPQYSRFYRVKFIIWHLQILCYIIWS